MNHLRQAQVRYLLLQVPVLFLQVPVLQVLVNHLRQVRYRHQAPVLLHLLHYRHLHHPVFHLLRPVLLNGLIGLVMLIGYHQDLVGLDMDHGTQAVDIGIQKTWLVQS